MKLINNKLYNEKDQKILVQVGIDIFELVWFTSLGHETKIKENLSKILNNKGFDLRLLK